MTRAFAFETRGGMYADGTDPRARSQILPRSFVGASGGASSTKIKRMRYVEELAMPPWNGLECEEVGEVSTAFGSTRSTESVSDGRMAMPTKSKSRTTSSAQRRLPLGRLASALVANRQFVALVEAHQCRVETLTRLA